MHAGVRSPLLVTAVLGLTAVGCTATATRAPGARPPTATSATPTATATPTPAPTSAVDKDSYQVGTCLDITREIEEVRCDQPHTHEVMLAQRQEQKRKPSRRLMDRACWGVLPRYLSTTEEAASRLEPALLGPWKGDDGKWRFACLATERGSDGEPVRRMRKLAGALSRGLGPYRRCLTGEPLADGPQNVVPCGESHRSEAIGVLPIKDFPAARDGLWKVASRAGEQCEAMAESYLGGKRRGVRSSGIVPLREQWLGGQKTGTCYVVSKTPVQGVMR
ncbi:septum formation family protein [Nonomuraea rubra]|uniref:septum formation family protein n=1 Tax=Nonomuraea rubra TaxID=46180 RepID=UPI0033C00477